MKGQQVRNGNSVLIPRAIPEVSIRAAVKHRMEERGIVTTITDTSPVFVPEGEPKFHAKVSTRGWPDLTGILAPVGLAVLVETKAKDGVLRPIQQALHARLRAAGAIVLVVRSVQDFDEQFNAALLERCSVNTSGMEE